MFAIVSDAVLAANIVHRAAPAATIAIEEYECDSGYRITVTGIPPTEMDEVYNALTASIQVISFEHTLEFMNIEGGVIFSVSPASD